MWGGLPLTALPPVAPVTAAAQLLALRVCVDVRARMQDTMIVHHEVLEHGSFDSRQQVVRWIRRFPFKFLSDREYSIARRLFVEGDAYYGITRSVPDHPAARRVRDPSTTQMEVFYSMWRSRTVPCPWGSGRPAVETLLLHHEQFKIPENLARFSVRHGMWGFVKGLSEKVPGFVATRRARGVDPVSLCAAWRPGALRQARTHSRSCARLSVPDGRHACFSKSLGRVLQQVQPLCGA